MTYADIAQLAADVDFMSRVTACHATLTPIGRPAVTSEVWTRQHVWQLASQPGLGEAYAAGLKTSGPSAGTRDPNAVTDAMILSGVQALVAAESA